MNRIFILILALLLVAGSSSAPPAAEVPNVRAPRYKIRGWRMPRLAKGLVATRNALGAISIRSEVEPGLRGVAQALRLYVRMVTVRLSTPIRLRFPGSKAPATIALFALAVCFLAISPVAGASVAVAGAGNWAATYYVPKTAYVVEQANGLTIARNPDGTIIQSAAIGADIPVIQAALNAVDTLGGGEVRLMRGTYTGFTGGDAYLLIPSNTTLRGSGTKTIILGNRAMSRMMSNKDELNGNSDALVCDFVLDGNGFTVGEMINWARATRCHVKDVVQYGRDANSGDGVDMDGCVDCHVVHCTFINLTGSAMHISDGHSSPAVTFTGEGSTRCFGIDNISTGCGGGLGTDRSSYNIFLRTGGTSGGLDCGFINCVSRADNKGFGTSDITQRSRFENCVVLNPTNTASSVGTCLDLGTTATDAYISDFIGIGGVQGIRCGGSTSTTRINGALLKSQTNSSLFLSGTNSYASNVSSFSSGANAIDISGDSCTFINGVAKDSTGQGIRITGTNATVSLCRVAFAGSHGISCTGNYAMIEGNRVRNSATVTGGTDGITLSGSNCSLIGNKCYDDRTPKTQRYGIIEASPADNNLITNNDVNGNLTNGIGYGVYNGPNTVYRGNPGFVSEYAALVTSTADGTQSSWVFSHGLPATPKWVSVDPQTSSARSNYHITVSASNITVSYNSNSPPAAGAMGWWVRAGLGAA